MLEGSSDRGELPRCRADARLVESMVASAFAVEPPAIRSCRRGPAPAAFARQVAIYLAHTRLGLSYTAVGIYFGRDRTTAAHACRTVENRREDLRIDRIIDLLEKASMSGRDRGWSGPLSRSAGPRRSAGSSAALGEGRASRLRDEDRAVVVLRRQAESAMRSRTARSLVARGCWRFATSTPSR